MATSAKAEAWEGESLAPELLLVITTKLPDLGALDSLLRASPNTFRLFNTENVVKITESILSSGSIHQHVRVIIYVIALIRSSALPISNLDDFTEQVMLEAMKTWPPALGSGFNPIRRSPTTSAVLRSILSTYRRITILTQGCLEFYLDRYRSLRPQHLADKTFRLHGVHP
ncbi:uncharacterized protein LY89DRAFT_736482 [Mollisia scopiformis]|uniref:Uncharacterized protein n=1 Tax=Mollisia scopiformis TaxID=149040 RepID=A0A194X2N7_MOLSC|nr:uncharacterized protein LY89DRAFT_736482 [Mollisia scopiformis]KUJ14448.1 hypothetical protein LY89DRAFT_736482 [Mollisia scopiformis]